MENSIILIGLGQLGRLFAGALLRTGHTLIPINRGDDPGQVAARHPRPALVLVAVAENDLHPTLSALPETWRDRAGLLQNELLPRDWQAHGLSEPTVISVWFEKKKGTDAKPILPSPVYGPEAGRIFNALAAIDLPARVLRDAASLEWELVRKNLYILTSNLCGIVTGGSVGELWTHQRALAENVAAEVLDIQEALTGHAVDRPTLMAGLVEAFNADPQHGCAGRTAPQRLRRALEHADAAGLAVPTLRRIAAQLPA